MGLTIIIIIISGLRRAHRSPLPRPQRSHLMQADLSHLC